MLKKSNTDRKQAYLCKQKNTYKQGCMIYSIPMNDILIMTKRKSLVPMDDELNDWVISYRTTRTVDRICFNPRAFCWATGQRLFLKVATHVYTRIDGPGSPVLTVYYFTPKHYTVWLLKDAHV
jgi:hypothetical protein